ncbi:MarC family protein [Hydrogenobaculum acidophilum]
MQDKIYFLIKYTIAIFAILNPFAAMPVLISLTNKYSKSDRFYVVRASSMYAGFILIFFLFFGDILFEIFGISLGAFQIGGGIILIFISIHMIFGQPHKERISQEEIEQAQDKDNIALVPLATPLLAGPGAISTVITMVSSNNSISAHVFFLIAITLACFGVFLVLIWSEQIMKIIGKTGVNIVSRLMGILLMALSMQFIINGLKASFPILVSKL